MKKTYRYLAGIAVALAAAACVTLVNFNHPDSAPVNSEVTVSMDVTVENTGNGAAASNVVVAMLAPVSWNIAETAEITFSSDDMPGGPWTNQTMRLAVDADVDMNGASIASVIEGFGTRENYEPVEWVVFVSEKQHSLPDGSSFSGTVNIKFKTGSENIRTNLSYFVGETYCSNYTDNGLDTYVIQDKVFETTGGSNDLIDYTVAKYTYVTPDMFTWEDIVAFNYDVNVEINGEPSSLKDADAVYFIGTAYYGDQTVTVDEISEKTLMLKEDNLWKKYMYPHEYFNIPAGTKIDKIEFHLTNADKSISLANPDGSEISWAETYTGE